MELVSYFPQFRATVLAVLPNIVQAYFAAVGDYYTWQLSEKIYGRGSNANWASVSSGFVPQGTSLMRV